MVKEPSHHVDPLQNVLAKLAHDRADRDAWMAVYHEIRPSIVARVFRCRLWHSFDLEEAVQEVMARIIRSAHFECDEDEPRRFRAYVSIVCRSVVVDHLRAHIHERRTESDKVQAEPASDPRSQFVHSQMIELLWGQLSQPERKLTKMLLDGYTAREISEHLNQTKQKTYNELTKLRKWARAVLADSPPAAVGVKVSSK